MMSRRGIWTLLALANVANALVVGVFLLAGQIGTSTAQTSTAQTSAAEAQVPPDTETLAEPAQRVYRRPADREPEPPQLGAEQAKQIYERLTEQLVEHQQVLEQKAEELSERERQIEVVREELEARKKEIADARQAFEDEQRRIAESRAPSFDRLLKAYEGMEPANAAKAIFEIYDKDPDVVVDLLLGLKPRQAAGILDSMAATAPRPTAELSLEIWRRDPRRNRPDAVAQP